MYRFERGIVICAMVPEETIASIVSKITDTLFNVVTRIFAL